MKNLKQPLFTGKKAIESVKQEYDFILIDTPPNLSIQTVNALIASDYVVIMFETAKFSYNAIPRFLESVEGARENGNPDLKIAGILSTLSDSRRTDVPFEDRVNDHLRKTFKTLTNITAPYFMKWSTAQGIKID